MERRLCAFTLWNMHCDAAGSEKRRRAMRRAVPTRWGNVIPFLIASAAIGWCLQNSESPAAEITAATTPSESAAYLVGFLPPNYPNTPPSRNRPPTGRNDTGPPRPPPVVPPNPPSNPPPPPRDDDTPPPPGDNNTPPQAPEPATVLSALVGTGMVGVYGWYRRRRQMINAL